jgi:hypothetical protein
MEVFIELVDGGGIDGTGGGKLDDIEYPEVISNVVELAALADKFSSWKKYPFRLSPLLTGISAMHNSDVR